MNLFFLHYLEQFGGPEIKNNGSRGLWTWLLGPNIMKMKTFWIFGKWEWEISSSPCSRTNLRSFWGNPFIKKIKNGPPDPPRPQIGSCLSSPYRAPLEPLHWQHSDLNRFPTYLSKMIRDFSQIFWSNLVPPKSRIIGLGSHGRVRQVREP